MNPAFSGHPEKIINCSRQEKFLLDGRLQGKVDGFLKQEWLVRCKAEVSRDVDQWETRYGSE